MLAAAPSRSAPAAVAAAFMLAVALLVAAATAAVGADGIAGEVDVASAHAHGRLRQHHPHPHNHHDDDHQRGHDGHETHVDRGGRPIHRCIHDEPTFQDTVKRHLADTPPVPTRAPSPSSRRADALAVQGLRVVFSDLDLNLTTQHCTAVGQTRPDFRGSSTTCRAEDILTSAKRAVLVTKVLPSALGIVRGMLAMEPLTANIVVPATACNGLSYSIPSAHFTTGVPNADYVLYVSAGRPPAGVLAFAGACGFDTNGRVLYGRANFGPEFLTWDDTSPAANDDLVKTAVHEIFHALGFTYSVMSGAGLTSTVTVRGKSATVHTGARGVAAARSFFNCPSLTAVELEDEGGSGSALSHPDKRIMPDDFMAASGGTLISATTIAMLADLGHYTPLSGEVQNSTFGRGAGCSFLSSKCDTTLGGRDKYFCFDATQVDVCKYDYTSCGSCVVSEYSSDLPAYFRYFSGQPRKGGGSFVDACPVIESYSNRVCNGERDATHSDYVLGFTFSRSSRCFRTSGVVRSGFGTGGVGETRCLQSRCVPDGSGGRIVQFRVNGSAWLDCSVEGASVGSLPNYSGTVTCPTSFNLFCDYYDTAPAPPDGFPENYQGSGATADDPYGQAPTNSGAIVWIEGVLKLCGAGWASVNTTTPPDGVISALQRDLAGLMRLPTRSVFISTGSVQQAAVGSAAKVLLVSYFLTDTTMTVETARARLAEVQSQNATAWLSRTRSAYVAATNANDNPLLCAHSAEYRLSYLERLFLALGVGPFSGVVVAAFIAVCLLVAILFCCCKNSCCPNKDEQDDALPTEDTGPKRHVPIKTVRSKPLARGGSVPASIYP